MNLRSLAIVVFSVLLVSCGTLQSNGYQAFTHSAKYRPADPMETFGVKGKVFNGRLYEVDAAGNGYMSRDAVRGFALWAAGKAAYDNGYKEFSILIENGDVSSSLQMNGYVSNHGYNSTMSQVNKFSVKLIILLITEADYSTVDKIFKAEKYYQPGSKL